MAIVIPSFLTEYSHEANTATTWWHKNIESTKQRKLPYSQQPGSKEKDRK